VTSNFYCRKLIFDAKIRGKEAKKNFSSISRQCGHTKNAVHFIYFIFRYTVDMTIIIGTCSCEYEKDEGPCKHQFVLWSLNLARVSQPAVRQKSAWIAIERSLPLSFYKSLCTPDDSTKPTSGETDMPELCSENEPAIQPSNSPSCFEEDACIDLAADALRKSSEQIM